jgi:predicted metal-dependent hydrolase
MQYEIIYKRIKNGYAKIQHDGSVQITIPYILRNNKKFEQALLLQAEKLRTKQQQKTKIHSRNAESLYLFGEDIALEDIEIANLRVNSKRDKYELFFQQTLLEYVEPLVAEYSTKIGYTYTSISIKRLTSKR